MIDLAVTYNRLEADISMWIEGFSLVEKDGKDASTLEITLCNADGRFTGAWQAMQGDSVAIRLGVVPAENYSIRSIAVSHAPKTVKWQCVARPVTTKSPSGRGSGSPPPKSGALVDSKKSWDAIPEISFSGLLARVCSECGLTPKYYPRTNPTLKNVVRYNESGWHLLDRYARGHGFSVRATSDKVQIIAPVAKQNDAKVEQQKISIGNEQILRFGGASKLAPAKVQSRRFDPHSAQIIEHSAGDGDGEAIDVSFDADGPAMLYDAIVMSGMARTLEVIPDARLVAGALIEIDGAGTMQISEMRYNRTADRESMQITTKEVKQ